MTNKELINKIQAITGLDLRTIRNGLKEYESELSPDAKLKMLAVKMLAAEVLNGDLLPIDEHIGFYDTILEEQL